MGWKFDLHGFIFDDEKPCNSGNKDTDDFYGGEVIAETVSKENAPLLCDAPAMFAALKAQHEAIDRLFALLITKVPGFYPTKSGQPWEACQEGNVIIQRVERGDVVLEANQRSKQ